MLDNWQPEVRVEHLSERYVKKFQTRGLDYSVRVNNLLGNEGEGLPINEMIARKTVALHEMLDTVLHDIPDHDFVRLVISNRYLQDLINLPFARRDHINVDRIFEYFQNF